MKDFLPLSSNGRIVSLILIALGYVLYYLSAFPVLVNMQNRNFWVEKFWEYPGLPSQPQSQGCDLVIVIKVSRYLTDYQHGNITINLINQKNEMCSGNLWMTGSLFSKGKRNDSYMVSFVSVDEQSVHVRNAYLNYKIPPHASQTFSFLINIPVREADEVRIAFVIDKTKATDKTKEELSLSGEDGCEDKSTICSTVDNYGVFRQSVLEKILLPPFANGFLPLFLFGVVWLSEISLSSSFLDNKENSLRWRDALKLLGLAVLVSALYIVGFFLLLLEKWFWCGLLVWLFGFVLLFIVSELCRLKSLGGDEFENSMLKEMRAYSANLKEFNRKFDNLLVAVYAISENILKNIKNDADSLSDKKSNVAQKYQCVECGETFWSINQPVMCPKSPSHKKGFVAMDSDSSL